MTVDGVPAGDLKGGAEDLGTYEFGHVGRGGIAQSMRAGGVSGIDREANKQRETIRQKAGASQHWRGRGEGGSVAGIEMGERKKGNEREQELTEQRRGEEEEGERQTDRHRGWMKRQRERERQTEMEWTRSKRHREFSLAGTRFQGSVSSLVREESRDNSAWEPDSVTVLAYGAYTDYRHPGCMLHMNRNITEMAQPRWLVTRAASSTPTLSASEDPKPGHINGSSPSSLAKTSSGADRLQSCHCQAGKLLIGRPPAASLQSHRRHISYHCNGSQPSYFNGS